MDKEKLLKLLEEAKQENVDLYNQETEQRNNLNANLLRREGAAGAFAKVEELITESEKKEKKK